MRISCVDTMPTSCRRIGLPVETLRTAAGVALLAALGSVQISVLVGLATLVLPERHRARVSALIGRRWATRRVDALRSSSAGLPEELWVAVEAALQRYRGNLWWWGGVVVAPAFLMALGSFFMVLYLYGTSLTDGMSALVAVAMAAYLGVPVLIFLTIGGAGGRLRWQWSDLNTVNAATDVLLRSDAVPTAGRPWPRVAPLVTRLTDVETSLSEHLHRQVRAGDPGTAAWLEGRRRGAVELLRAAKVATLSSGGRDVEQAVQAAHTILRAVLTGELRLLPEADASAAPPPAGLTTGRKFVILAVTAAVVVASAVAAELWAPAGGVTRQLFVPVLGIVAFLLVQMGDPDTAEKTIGRFWPR